MDVFQRKNKYDLTPFLPILIEPGKDNLWLQKWELQRKAPFEITTADDRIRYDYSRTLSDIFINSYIKPLSRWTKQRGARSRTEPFGWEIDLIKASGQSDIPSSSQSLAGGSSLFMKLISSGGHLYNRPLISTEALSFPGQAYSFTPLKSKIAIDNLFCMGYNQLIVNGLPYKIDEKKYGENGWNPQASPFNPEFVFSSFADNQRPYGQHTENLNAYISRCQYILRQGKPQVDIWIYYPFLGFPLGMENIKDHPELMYKGRMPYESTLFNSFPIPGGAFDLLPKEKDPRVMWLKEVWRLIDALESKGLVWDWVNDESIQNASYESGELIIRGNKAQAILVPNAPSIELETARNLAVLNQKGANVIIYGDPPEKQPGFFEYEENDSRIALYMRELTPFIRITAPEDLQNLLIGYPFPQQITYSGTYDFLRHTRREHSDGSVWVFFQNLTNKGRFFDLTLNDEWDHYYWFDPMDGTYQIASDIMNRKDRIRSFIDGYGTYFLYCKNGNAINDSLVVESDVLNPRLWKGRQPTVRNLTRWHFYIAGQDVKGKEKELSLLDTTLQSWQELPELVHCSSEGLYTSYFEIGDTLSGVRYLLDLGEVYGTADVKINTEPVINLIQIPFQVEITDFLTPGMNTIEVWLTPPLRNRYLGWANDGKDAYLPFRDKEKTLLPAGIVGPAKVWEFIE